MIEVLNMLKDALFSFDGRNIDILYSVLVACSVAAIFVKKDESARRNIVRFLIAFVSVLLVEGVFYWQVGRVLYEYTGNPTVGCFTVFMLVWPLLAVSYLFVSKDFNTVSRVITAALLVVLVLFVAGWQSNFTFYLKHDYTLSGSYTMSNNEEVQESYFHEHVLTIGQKGSGQCVEGFNVDLTVPDGEDVSLACRAHIQNIGWYDWSSEGTTLTYDRGYGIDTVQFMLYGKDACRYDVLYRIAVVGEEWQDWQNNGFQVGLPDMDRLIETIEIRLVPVENEMDNTWTITQYSDYSGLPSMFYTIRNNEDGTLIAVNGGGEEFGSQMRSIINLYGGRVDYWFITYDDYWHTAGFNSIRDIPGDIEIGEVYMLSQGLPESLEIDGLQVQAVDGGLLKIIGKENSILFLSDMVPEVSEEIVSSASYVVVDLLNEFSTFNRLPGSSKPDFVLLDAPSWMVDAEGYNAYAFYWWCVNNGVRINYQFTAPNSVPLE